MPKMNLCFQGWLRGVEIRRVTETASGEYVDVSQLSAEEVEAKLSNGEWLVSLKDLLNTEIADEEEIEIFDFAKGE